MTSRLETWKSLTFFYSGWSTRRVEEGGCRSKNTTLCTTNPSWIASLDPTFRLRRVQSTVDPLCHTPAYSLTPPTHSHTLSLNINFPPACGMDLSDWNTLLYMHAKTKSFHLRTLKFRFPSPGFLTLFRIPQGCSFSQKRCVRRYTGTDSWSRFYPSS